MPEPRPEPEPLPERLPASSASSEVRVRDSGVEPSDGRAHEESEQPEPGKLEADVPQPEALEAEARPAPESPRAVPKRGKRAKRERGPLCIAHCKRRRRRRWLGFGLLLAPGLWFLASDLVRRPDAIFAYDKLHAIAYWGTSLGSFFFWALVLYAAARRRGIVARLFAGIFAVLFTLAAGVQGAFHGTYNQYLSQDGQIYSKSLPDALLGYLPFDRFRTWAYLIGALAASLVLIRLARRYVRPRRIARTFIPVLSAASVVGMTMVPASYRTWHSTSQDIIYFHGFTALVKERLRKTDEAPELRTQRRHPEPVPAMVAAQPVARNVLFILQESQRYDVSCNSYVPDPKPDEDGCATWASNAATPGRFGLEQVRSTASTTAISISHLWSGVPSVNGLDSILTVPVLWEYAHAAGFDTAYWTSQHVMFGSNRLYVQDFPLSKFAAATHLDPFADFDAGAYDRLLTDRAIQDIDTLHEPYFAVVHYSNVHFPYVYDKEHAPFQPAVFNRESEHNREFFNYYKDVVYLSDLAVGRLIEHLRSTESGRRTVVLYTSDHAESFREHWELGHTSSIYDEEIHVPAWIDAPPGTLTEAEAASLRGAKDEYITHYDFTPTMLDLLGLWDAPELRPFRKRMPGNPITRPARTVEPVPLLNCAWVWECGFRNWGLLQGHIKLEAREWDDEFHCFDLAADPRERHNLGEAACAPLPDVARRILGRMPVEKPPQWKDLLWGPPPPEDKDKPAE